MIINHNLMANNAINKMNSNSANASKSMQKLSSGLRINSAADDAAGLAISEKMRGQIRGLDQASSNAQDGISMIQTAEGALNETESILQRMRELSVQSSNDTNTDDDRTSIQDEIKQLKDEIDRIGNTTEFNTQKLLDGSKGAKTTSAELTAGNAVDVSSTNKVSILDGSETKNNVLVVKVQISASTTVDLNVNMDEGEYTDLVSFTKEFNTKLKEAAQDLADKGGVDATATVAKFSLGFNVDSTTSATSGQVQFSLSGQATTNESIKIMAGDAATDQLTQALGMKAADTSLTLVGKGATTLASATASTHSSIDGGSTAVKWDEFDIKIEDGLNPTANQNNKLTMTYDGLTINSEVAEGNYTSEASLADAVKNAIIGVNSTNSTAYTTYAASSKAGSDFATLASTGTPDGLVKAVNDMTDAELEAKGYKGATDDMKAAYFNDLISKDGTSLTVSYNSEHKLEINGPAEMEFDETSQVASKIGMTDVNADIKNSGVTMQIGANSGQTMTVSIADMRTAALGTSTDKLSDIDVSTKEGAQSAMDVLDQAIKQVSSERSKLGAYQNRLEHTINNLSTSSENLTSAESRIRDVDMAKEMSTYSKNNILSQAAQAMLAQANQAPQQVLQLLR